jgi:hypothetical protein
MFVSRRVRVRSIYEEEARTGSTILSMPLGPRDVRTASLMARKLSSKQLGRIVMTRMDFNIPFAATMFDNRSSVGLPCKHVVTTLDHIDCSVSRMYLVIEGSVGVQSLVQRRRSHIVKQCRDWSR